MDRIQLSTLLLIIFLSRSYGCPETCTCKWKNGKQTVECANKNFIILPVGIDSGTQVLDFSGNSLTSLSTNQFLKLELINLQRIYLLHCNIITIENEAFKGLTNLVELDLSHNLIETIPTRALMYCVSVMRLILNHNPIKIIEGNSFNQLSFLNTLELSFCEIEKVDENAFQGLQSLEWLRINNNKLKKIRNKTTLPNNLKGIELQGNMWECDCHLVDLHSWLESFSIPQFAEPECSGPPKLLKRTIKSIASAELACLPDISPTAFYLEIGEGKNISLLCQINAVPEAHITWWFHGQILQNESLISPGLRLIYYVEEGTENKKSELFIQNTNADDNGTFTCNAENPAGAVQSNFTIRIILRKDPVYEVNTFPFEFLLIILSATIVSVVVICFAIILTIIKFCDENNKNKEQSHIIKNSNNLLESTDDYSEMSKESSNATTIDKQQNLYSTHSSEEILSSISSATNNRSMITLNYCQMMEQNPDLLNDTETIERRKEGDGEDKQNKSRYDEIINFEHLQGIPIMDIPPLKQKLRGVSVDVHLNPVGLLSASNSTFIKDNCYKTLPYNRDGKRQKISRFQEAENFKQPTQLVAYEHHIPNIRYTADGYPVREQETQFSDNDSVRSCCSAPPVQWPVFIAPKSVVINPVPKISVVAQTQTDLIPTLVQNVPCSRLVCSALKIEETLSESLDEGYEGESSQDAHNRK